MSSSSPDVPEVTPAPPPPAPPPAPPIAPAGVPQATLVPKNPAISLLISALIPGLGSILNDKKNTGFIVLGGYIVSIFLCFVLIGLLTLPAFWIWGLVDAYQSANQWNAAHGFATA